MGRWASDSRTHVATMSAGDFRHNEQSVTVAEATTARIGRVGRWHGLAQEGGSPLAGEIMDSTYMSKAALTAFLSAQIADARRGDLFSLHEGHDDEVSDPIIFGHAVRAYFADLFATHGATFDTLGVDVNNGLATSSVGWTRLPPTRRPRSRPTSPRPTPTALPSRWSLRQGHHESPRAQ